MKYRRIILKRLRHFYDNEGPPGILELNPIDIIGKPGNKKFVAAINQLLAEKLILAQPGVESNRPAFCLNPDRIDDIEKELLWYRDPALQFLVGTVIAVGGLAWAVIEYLIKQ